MMGDAPIFVALDSSDVWANSELFQLKKNGQPKAVAGVPPDYFAVDGQLWGNPLYDWAMHEQTGFASSETGGGPSQGGVCGSAKPQSAELGWRRGRASTRDQHP